MRSAEQRNSIIMLKRNARDKALGFASPYLVNDHDVYTEATASEIVQRIAKEEWTSSRVLEAYIARSAMAQAEANCLTEVLYEDARKRAKELDTEFATTKTLQGPFHGVPFSIKDNYQIEGYNATTGLTAWANNPGKKDACICPYCNIPTFSISLFVARCSTQSCWCHHLREDQCTADNVRV
ncbi:amidase signature domain-containing protein [Suillus tomentosus]|nr:amidase signature domain-containing protein [Suillus tomentosus]